MSPIMVTTETVTHRTGIRSVSRNREQLWCVLRPKVSRWKAWASSPGSWTSSIWSLERVDTRVGEGEGNRGHPGDVGGGDKGSELRLDMDV